ncbi:uncharacterized protein zgc:153292 isoform X3 [Synchiropus splendidus]|uniref:uncharacterized protein zgc:153292 isoform X3 n=1 Tax=Synchiropus splendidus TaxID=270530 RepID=UPI00237E3266|nr:uncharacterized protein zgc:153292 isoform X3 [Synchiropus splendidus]
MGRYNCAYNCDNPSDSDVKYFKFPLYNKRRLKKWLSNMKWDDWTPSRFSVLCSRHFEEEFIDRTGKCVTLREEAVPTIFESPEENQAKAPSSTRNGRQKSPAVKAAAAKSIVQNKQSSQSEDDAASSEDSAPSEKWRVIVDESLMKIDSFPHFFHGDYCATQDILWAPDDSVGVRSSDPENVIEVTGPWQWLGLDLRGPLPKTPSGHRYLLTMTDFFSKWVEAAPLESCLPSLVAKNVSEVIAHFGFPLGILSRLPQELVSKINTELQDQLTISVPLLVHHQQAGRVDADTQQVIDRMVNGLLQDHASDWDVYLPAQVFSLCFQEDLTTRRRPFSVLCCGGVESVPSPREPQLDRMKIQDSAFVIT